MLLCNINFYKSIPNKFDSCIDFINNFKINPLPPGRYDLNTRHKFLEEEKAYDPHYDLQQKR